MPDCGFIVAVALIVVLWTLLARWLATSTSRDSADQDFHGSARAKLGRTAFVNHTKAIVALPIDNGPLNTHGCDAGPTIQS